MIVTMVTYGGTQGFCPHESCGDGRDLGLLTGWDRRVRDRFEIVPEVIIGEISVVPLVSTVTVTNVSFFSMSLM